MVHLGRRGAAATRGFGLARRCRNRRIRSRCRSACTRSAAPASGSRVRTRPHRLEPDWDAIALRLLRFVCWSRCQGCEGMPREGEAPHKGWGKRRVLPGLFQLIFRKPFSGLSVTGGGSVPQSPALEESDEQRAGRPKRPVPRRPDTTRRAACLAETEATIAERREGTHWRSAGNRRSCPRTSS